VISALGISRVKPEQHACLLTGQTSSPAFPSFPANTLSRGRLPPASLPVFLSLIDTALPKSTALNYSTFLGGAGTLPFGTRGRLRQVLPMSWGWD